MGFPSSPVSSNFAGLSADKKEEDLTENGGALPSLLTASPKGESRMARIASLSVATILLLLSSAGCTSPLQALIRGQSPAAPPAQPAAAATYVATPHAGEIISDEPVSDCPDGKCKEHTGGWHWLFGLKGRGHRKAHGYHIHNWTYSPPRGLVYPPANQPAGVWFYPYYTLKGPDDFFYTGK